MTNMQLADGSLSDTSGAQSSRKAATQTCVGSLTRSLPAYVRNPPIEAAVFAWGVAEDGQLVRSLLLAVLIAQLSCTAVSLLWHTCIIIACCCAMHQTSCRAFYTRRVSTLEAHRLFACCKATEKLLGRHSIAQSRRHCASAQGVDTDQNVVSAQGCGGAAGHALPRPRVPALTLGAGPARGCLLHPSRSQVPASQPEPRHQVPGPQHVDRGTSRESIVCPLFQQAAAGCSRDLQAHLEQWGINSSVRVPLGRQHALGRAGGGQPKHAGHRLRGPGAVVGLECARHARSRP